MSVLILRLAGPMQSWGDSSRFNRRETRTEPTKSAVIGLLASAQGRRREDSIEDLLGLRFGVRSDQPGRIMRDFQTEKSIARKKSGEFSLTMPLTHRYYLADAKFLVAIEGERSLLESLDAALRNPQWPLFLGRRSCPPASPVSLGVKDYANVEEALDKEPWIASPWYRKKVHDSKRLQVVVDAVENGETTGQQSDMPLSFSQKHRRYAQRPVRRYFVDCPTQDSATEPSARQTDNRPPEFTGAADPMSLM
ncbi:type I-E CRISPR-associated protein Cas5/CasD [Bifidobacterium gallicum]|uniref:CRISPR system CASCADE complex protein CasD n=1 Tax=Bifidobacterium gallicum DSM 20093 = LMG 11596 TaxID=561180 RepID=D1NTI1_9BIFI|nr:type I-E CRISPR-associated protein Cas5/CasD [Bifidobacterium gallicum]EFA23035.1 CRISPR system CASCADE complex protein CasD [Bifidobacterium gallicum DSM 20093 = LMG 11596]KFI57657.1 CRISPR-associated protein Cas5 [Bifidobacterium gallicum DSM 20093 = LMG 11596]